jgi:glycosyltransferase involved in cell wall biosynthesis
LVTGYDVIHIHNLWQFPQYAAYKAALDHGIPYVISPHGGLDPYLRQRGRTRKRISTALWQGEMLNRAALIHVTTQAEKQLIADVAPHVERAVVPCGLYVAEFASPPGRETFRRERLGGYDGPVVMFIGRITQKKGIDVLIRAFARVRRTIACRLVIIGPDDEGLLPKLRRNAANEGVVQDVDFLEPVYGEERLRALASADLWALTSHTENFGIAVVEAMAAGCAVVTTPGVNLAADIAAHGAGVIAPAAPEPFSEALLELLNDPVRRSHLQQKARAFATRYDWEVVAPRLFDMYQTAAAGRSA